MVRHFETILFPFGAEQKILFMVSNFIFNGNYLKPYMVRSYNNILVSYGKGRPRQNFSKKVKGF
jgi:hypothetical protein